MGLDRSAYLRERHGAQVTWRPFDLHPEIPDEGLPAERLGFYLGHLDRVRAEVEASGLPWRTPTVIPRTREALEATEHVGHVAPDAVHDFHHDVMTGYWAEGLDIGRRGVLLAIAGRHGVDGDTLAAALDEGRHAEAVDASKRDAYDVGAGATPSWWIDRRFVLPGAQPREVFDRILVRLG